MKVVEKVKKFDISVSDSETQIEIRICGDFENVSAYPIRKVAEKVYIRFNENGKVIVEPCACGGVAGNVKRTMNIDEFCNALIWYGYTKEKLEDVARERDNLKKNNEMLREKIESLKENIAELEKEIEKTREQKRTYSKKYENVWFEIKNDRQLKAVMRKIVKVI